MSGVPRLMPSRPPTAILMLEGQVKGPKGGMRAPQKWLKVWWMCHVGHQPIKMPWGVAEVAVHLWGPQLGSCIGLPRELEHFRIWGAGGGPNSALECTTKIT